MPPDTLLVSDTGHAGMWTGGMIDLNKPGQGFIRAAGSLGWGLPAALRAKLAQPDRPVLLFSGDGGFWYHLSELETAVRWKINAVLLVNNNKSLNQEIAPYTEAYGGQLRARHAELWQFRDVSFAELARTMGAEGFRVQSPSDLSGALARAFASRRPSVVEVMTEIAPWLLWRSYTRTSREAICGFPVLSKNSSSLKVISLREVVVGERPIVSSEWNRRNGEPSRSRSHAQRISR